MKNENLLIGLVILIMAVLLVNLFSGSVPNNIRELAYSDFLNQLKTGHVMNAEINGDSIVQGILNDGTPYMAQVPANYPGLIDQLMEQQIQVNYIPDMGPPWYINLLIQWGPFLLIFAIWFFLMRRMQGGAGKIFSLGRNKAQRVDPNQHQITFKDVAGVDESKEELVEIIEFLRDPAKFRKLGGRIPKGVLMSGPPGTGKTMLAKAVSGEAEVPFFSISGSDFVEMFVGVGASRVRDLFDEGRRNAPCILFIDEIDAVGRHRGSGLGSSNDEREQTLNQLLVEMDGFDTSEGIIIIASTNRPDVLDPALLRPGRFDRQVSVPLPDIRGREAILKVHAQKVVLADNVDFSVVAKGTPGFSGADLKNLVNEAALGAARHNKSSVTREDFDWARDKILMGPERRSMVMSEAEKLSTAYHEAGHALVSALLPKTDPVHKVTVVPRGRALGITSFLPESDHRSYDVEYLSNKITISLGGRAAEEIIFDALTTGASNDIQQATDTIRNMICRWGMSDALGPIVMETEEQHHVLGRDIGKEREYSEDTAVKIDREMRQMINFHYQKAKQLLQDNLEIMHQIAKILMEEETIDGSRILDMLGRDITTLNPV
ncbi:MAG: ATP-dependent zinc metalloprotease FtsH [SAR324 cluster bacterium]|nr:ATP-dependent zinc metalloprotease FtsH [SAR324 cluster bacterium]